MGNNLDCSCAQRKETEKEVYYTNREISLNVNEFMPCKVRTIKLMEKVIVDTTVQNEVDVGDDYNDEEELMKDEEEGEGEDREGMVVKAGRKRSVNISGNEEELNNDEEKCSDEKEHCDDVNVNNESHMKNDNDNNNNKDDNNVNINNEMNSHNDNNACIDNDNINININEMNKITEETPNSPINKIETPVDNDKIKAIPIIPILPAKAVKIVLPFFVIKLLNDKDKAVQKDICVLAFFTFSSKMICSFCSS